MPRPTQTKLLKKVGHFRKIYAGSSDPSNHEQIAEWESDVKQAILLDNLQAHDGIKLILKRLLTDIKHIDAKLLTFDSTQLPDKERDRLLDKKELYQSFTLLFVDSEKKLVEIDKEMDEKLALLGEDVV